MKYTQRLLIFTISLILGTVFTPNYCEAQVKLDWLSTVKTNSNVLTIETDDQENVYTLGIFQDTAIFNPDSASQIELIAKKNYSSAYFHKQDSSGSVLWARAVHSAGNSFPDQHTLDFDQLGNVYVTGTFRDSMKLDSAGVEITVYAEGSIGAYLLKLDANGNYLWLKLFQGKFSVFTLDIELDPFDNVILSGYLTDTSDLDPGPNQYTMIPIKGSNNAEMFLMKLSSQGKFIWAKQIGDIRTEYCESIVTDEFGNIYGTGQFKGRVDFDPGPDSAFLVASNLFSALFVLRLDSSGNYVWAHKMNSSSLDYGLKITYTKGKLYSTGQLGGPADMDPDTGTSIISGEIYIQKLDTSGDFDWAVGYGNGWANRGTSISYDDEGSIYSCGWFRGSLDFDPGPDSLMITSQGNYDFYINKLYSDGTLAWTKGMGGKSQDLAYAISVSNKNKIHFGGVFSDTVNFDFANTNKTLIAVNSNRVILKLTQDKCADFQFKIDSFENNSCNESGFASLDFYGGTKPFVYQWSPKNSADSTFSTDSAGIYKVIVSDSNSCIDSMMFLVSGPRHIDSIDFTSNLLASTFRPVTQSWIQLDLINYGCDTGSGVLILCLDSMLSVDSIQPSPDSIVANQIFWSFTDFSYADDFEPVIYVTTDTSANIGDQICLTTKITSPSNEIDTNNNIRNHCFEVINSYDPNDKKVFPEGECDSGFIHSDVVLVYKIRFQNTGTAPAIDIFVIDTLDINLDVTSVSVLKTSHEPMVTEVLTGGILKFIFNDIQLPDSNTDESESHGYIIYEVKAKDGIPSNTVIENTASIYFDFNAPVRTNSTRSFLVDSIPALSSKIIQDSFGGLHAVQNGANYQWYDCTSGLAVPNANSQDFIPTYNGSFYAKISSAGCSELSDCYQFVFTGIPEGHTQDQFIFFPNPFNQNVSISKPLAILEYSLVIYDITGRIIAEKQQINADKFSLSLNGPKGIYFYEILTEKGQKRVYRLMKQ